MNVCLYVYVFVYIYTHTYINTLLKFQANVRSRDELNQFFWP